MKLIPSQIKKISREVCKSLKKSPSINIDGEEEAISAAIEKVIKQNMQDEENLNQAVNGMMDELEKQNPGAFERYKMFPLLKKKLAKQKGFVL